MVAIKVDMVNRLRVDIGGLDTARIGASPAIDAIKFAAIWRQAEGLIRPFLLLR